MEAASRTATMGSEVDVAALEGMSASLAEGEAGWHALRTLPQEVLDKVAQFIPKRALPRGASTHNCICSVGFDCAWPGVQVMPRLPMHLQSPGLFRPWHRAELDGYRWRRILPNMMAAVHANQTHITAVRTYQPLADGTGFLMIQEWVGRPMEIVPVFRHELFGYVRAYVDLPYHHSDRVE